MPRSIEDTAELRPVCRDPSWFVLAVAVLAAVAFTAGVYSAIPARQRAGGEPAAAPTMPPAAPAAGASPAEESPNGYLLVASTDPRPPAEPPIALPADAKRVFVHYRFPDWPLGTRPQVEVTVGGKKADSVRVEWVPGSPSVVARGSLVLSPPDGESFPRGIYMVRFMAPDGREDTLSFAVIPDLDRILGHQPPAGGLLITDSAVTPALTADGAPAERAGELRGASEVYFWFAYDAAVDGTVVEVHWFLNDRLVKQASARLRLKRGSGTAAAYIKSSEPLPPGKWSVGVYLEGGTEPLAGASFTILSPPAGSQGDPTHTR